MSVVTALNFLATPEEKLAKAPKNLCLPSEELVHVVVNVPFVWSVKVLVNVMGPITTPSSLTVSTPVLLDGVHRAARLNGPSPVLKPEDGHFPPLIFEQRMDPLQFNPKMLWADAAVPGISVAPSKQQKASAATRASLHNFPTKFSFLDSSVNQSGN
ncbi:MAG: hypothetical protein JOZ29_04445 [Deltaproteobacteria bacterium]|nr:hypothetical protein [Deltaproteobacteria bacterium]